MAVLILVFAFTGILMALLPAARKQAPRGAAAYALLGAGVVFGVLLTVSTEALSAMRAVTSVGLLLFWSVVTASSFVLMRHLGKRVPDHPGSAFPALSGLERLVLALLGVLAAVTLIVALAAPPNTPDSLVYHMSRVAHWQANRTVAFYPTPILRQLHMPPWAEYAILHAQVLSGGDGFANLVQWAAMVGSVLAVYHLAGLLGARRIGRLAAAVFAATIPMGILQATSTQNDHVCAFWLLSAVAFGTHMLRAPARGYLSACLFGGAVGLAMLTKATACLYLFPFLCGISLTALRRFRRRAILPLATAGLIALLINLPHFARNQSVFGTPVGTSDHGTSEVATESYANQIHSLPAILSNVMRNAGLHMITPSRFINGWIERGIRRGHNLLGIDIHDIRTTWIGTHYQTKPLSTSEDEAANPIHFVLLLVAAITATAAALRQRRFAPLAYTAMVAAGALTFCVVLRWQPWHSRLHLPLFLAGAPVVGIVLSGRKRIAAALMLLMLLGSVPYLAFNESRPLCGRRSVLTTPRVDLIIRGQPAPHAWHKAVDHIAANTRGDVWLVMNGKRFEYALWALARQHRNRSLAFRHANVPNLSSHLNATSHHQPEYALELARTNATLEALTIDGHRFLPESMTLRSDPHDSTVVYRRGP